MPRPGQIVGMDVLVNRDTEGFVDWLSGYVSELGVEAMVTDDLSTYKPVVDRTGCGSPGMHRACEEERVESSQGDRWVGLVQVEDMVVARASRGRRSGAIRYGASSSF